MRSLIFFTTLLIVGCVSRAQTWTRRFALAVDILTASVIWTRRDGVTISSYCGVAIRQGKAGNKFLRLLGWVLNHIQKNHCELAMQDDKVRAFDAINFLNSVNK